MSNKAVIPHASQEPGGGLSFQEKSLWLSLFNSLVVFGVQMFYFLRIDEPDMGDFLSLMIGVTVLMIIVEIATHILLAIGWREEGPDERDRHVALLAQRSAYVVLTTGSVSVMLMAVVPLITRVWLAFGVLTTLVLAEIVKFAVQLYHYRRSS